MVICIVTQVHGSRPGWMSVENGSSFAPILLAPSQDSLLKHCPSRISSRILSPVLGTGSQRTLHHALHRFFFFFLH